MISIDTIHVAYSGKSILKGLSLNIEKGEFFTLLGPSGCGKTTLLRTISGFVSPVSGAVRIHGKDVTAQPPEKRGVGIVFQNYALFPHLSVFENVAFGLRVAHKGKQEIGKAALEALERSGVAEHRNKKPDALSGGQQQRVAIARALVVGADILLLDEPLSNLDAKLRETMRAEIRSLQQRLGLTAVYVTHDQQEALAISDRIGVMNAGHIDQIGSPREIYHTPKTDFVCRFVGETNALSASLLTHMGAQDLAAASRSHAIYARPEDFSIGANTGSTEADTLTFTAKIRSLVFYGATLRAEVMVDDELLTCDVDGRFVGLAAGDDVSISIARDNLYFFEREAI